MSRPSRLLSWVILGAFCALLCVPGHPPLEARDAPPPAGGGGVLSGGPLKLDGALIRQGLAMLGSLPISEAGVRARWALRVPVLGKIAEGDVALNVKLDNLKEQIKQIDSRLASETNEVLRQQLEVMRQQLEVERKRNELLREQNRTLARLADAQVQMFEYAKLRDEAVLRKEQYAVPADKLVVVVADFSSGRPDEGREVADEIAHHLTELTRFGIGIHVLNGEVRPGVIVRSEHMARDMARHFPEGTDYAVVWGFMSPRTVGQYRPQITFVQHAGPRQAVSVTFPIPLETGKLPEKGQEEAYRRQCYERLIGATCAAIPAFYASYLINRDREPDFEKFYAFLGDSEPETKKLRQDLEPLTRWIRARSAYARGGASLRRMAEISASRPYPQAILNEKDGSVMVLITDADGQPRRFKNKTSGREEIVYIDVLETTTYQYVRFLHEQGGNKEEGGTRWLLIEPEFSDIQEVEGKGFEARPKVAHRPIINVSWFGARAYCRWAGKDLPAEEEWLAAASPRGPGSYPWGTGDDVAKRCNTGADGWTNLEGGRYSGDLSPVGCFDMAGNVAEWCADWYAADASKRVVKGGSFNDKGDLTYFAVKERRGIDQVKQHRWIGFRGVLRLGVEK